MKKSLVLAFVVSLAVFGCKKKEAAATGDGSGSGSGSADTMAVGSGSGSATMAAAGGGGAAASDGDCKVAIDHGMELSAPMMSKMPNYADLKDKMRDMGIKHCTADKWSTDAVKCMSDAKTMQDAQGCYGKLTADQSTKMNDDAKSLMAAPAAGSGSGSAAAAGSGSGSGSGSAK